MRWASSTASRWIITMNTRTETFPSQASADEGLEDQAGAAASVASSLAGSPQNIEVLTRLANEMFSQVPGGGYDTAFAPAPFGGEAAGGSPEFLPPWRRSPWFADAEPVNAPL